MDFIIGLPLSKYTRIIYNYILVIVDRFMKIAYYLAIKKIIIAKKLAKLFFFKIACKFSILVRIISNRGNIFISTF